MFIFSLHVKFIVIKRLYGMQIYFHLELNLLFMTGPKIPRYKWQEPSCLGRRTPNSPPSHYPNTSRPLFSTPLPVPVPALGQCNQCGHLGGALHCAGEATCSVWGPTTSSKASSWNKGSGMCSKGVVNSFKSIWGHAVWALELLGTSHTWKEGEAPYNVFGPCHL